MKWKVAGLLWITDGTRRYGYREGFRWDGRTPPLYTIEVWGSYGRGRRTYELLMGCTPPLPGLGVEVGSFREIASAKYVAEYLHIINEGLDGEG